ncbi:MAG: hypothetical protein AAGA55_10270 [Planctomycetota bacterium]
MENKTQDVLHMLEALLTEMTEQQCHGARRVARRNTPRAERYRAMQARMGVPGLVPRDHETADPGAMLRSLMVEARGVFENNRSLFREMAMRGFDALTETEAESTPAEHQPDGESSRPA